MLLLSQYGTDFSLSIAHCNNRWLDYMTEDPDTPPFRAQSVRELGEQDMLRLHRIGIYDARKSERMYQLSALLAAVLITDKGNFVPIAASSSGKANIV